MATIHSLFGEKHDYNSAVQLMTFLQNSHDTGYVEFLVNGVWLLELLSWYPVMWSNLYNLLKIRHPEMKSSPFSMSSLCSFSNSSPPNATNMRQLTGSALVQVMACCLFSAKPLPEAMLFYCQMHPWEEISWKF